MIYPKFLNENSKISVIAPSAGIGEEKKESFDLSLSRIEANGWKIKESASVRSGLLESADPKTRVKELNEAFCDPETDAVFCACGGDLLTTMLNHLDPQVIMNNPKWLQGYSDPTNLLYPITTCLDVATIYGCNAGGFDAPDPGKTAEYNFEILKGNIPAQENFETYIRKNYETGEEESLPVKWTTPNGDFIERGRLLGGCMDCLMNLIGTKYDGTISFCERYFDDGVIWYFDIFSLTAEQVYLTLWHMKEAGWFNTARGFIFGRVCFEKSFVGMTYEEAVLKALDDAPIIMEADVGHVWPRMTFINGAIANVKCKDGKGEVKLTLC